MSNSSIFGQIRKNHQILLVIVLLAALAAGIYAGINLAIIALLIILLCPIMLFLMTKEGQEHSETKKNKTHQELPQFEKPI